MLILRAAIRSRLRLNVISTTIRHYRPTPCHLYQPLAQPYTWRTRIWYRQDGTPRSKLKGTLYAITAFSILILFNSLQEASDEIYLLSILVRVQRVDADFSSYDLSTPQGLIDCLSKIVSCLPSEVNREEIDTFNDAIRHLMETTPQLHGHIREQLEGIHNLLIRHQDADPLDTAEALLQELRILGEYLVELSQKAHGIAIGMKEQKPSDGDTYGVVG